MVSEEARALICDDVERTSALGLTGCRNLILTSSYLLAKSEEASIGGHELASGPCAAHGLWAVTETAGSWQKGWT